MQQSISRNLNLVVFPVKIESHTIGSLELIKSERVASFTNQTMENFRITHLALLILLSISVINAAYLSQLSRQLTRITCRKQKYYPYPAITNAGSAMMCIRRPSGKVWRNCIGYIIQETTMAPVGCFTRHSFKTAYGALPPNVRDADAPTQDNARYFVMQEASAAPSIKIKTQ